MLCFDGVCAAEQESGFARLNHRQVVMTVSTCDGFISDRLQRLNRGVLRLLNSHLIAGDLAVLSYLEGVAEDGGHTEFFHKRSRKLGKGIGKDDDLAAASQLVKELLGAGHGVYLGDSLLDLFKTETVLLEDTDAVLHELIVIGLVPCGPLELGDAACFRKSDPDLGDKDSFKVETGDIH